MASTRKFILRALILPIAFSFMIFQHLSTADSPTKLAKSYFDNHEYKKAILAYNEISQKGELDVTSIINLSASYGNLGYFEKALKILQKAYEKTHNPLIGYKLAMIYQKFGIDHEKAKVLFSSILNSNALSKNDKSIVLNELGMIAAQNSKYQLAMDYWDKSIRLNNSLLSKIYIAKLYFDGNGVKQDPKKAISMVNNLQCDTTDCRYVLSQFYAEILFDYWKKKNDGQAKIWAIKSSKLGNILAKKFLFDIGYSLMSASVDPSSIIYMDDPVVMYRYSGIWFKESPTLLGGQPLYELTFFYPDLTFEREFAYSNRKFAFKCSGNWILRGGQLTEHVTSSDSNFIKVGSINILSDVRLSSFSFSGETNGQLNHYQRVDIDLNSHK